MFDEKDHNDWRRQIYTDRTPFTRWLLQFIGTDIVRARISPTYWTDQGTYKIQSALAMGRKVVVPDLRFVNEANVIRLFNGDIVRIERADGKGQVEAGAGHPSETEQDEIIADHTISVPSGVEGLLAAADRLVDAESVH